ncbi:hypothetical protein MJN69_31075, partial [Salmonella enterica subsp. enterica serovar Kentucky]|nr:hypothetical protein [Salmonella enterica subsp. enterica serovar Kentucky]
PPFSVLSCDNIPENGHLTKTAIVTFADNLDPQLAAWIAKHVTDADDALRQGMPVTVKFNDEARHE